MSAYLSYEQWIASYAVCVLTPVACGIVLAVVLKHLNGILNRITAKRSAINEALERALATELGATQAVWKSLSYPERYSSKNARKMSIIVAVVLGIAPGVTFVLIDLVLFPFFFFGSLTMILVVLTGGLGATVILLVLRNKFQGKCSINAVTPVAAHVVSIDSASLQTNGSVTKPLAHLGTVFPRGQHIYVLPRHSGARQAGAILVFRDLEDPMSGAHTMGPLIFNTNNGAAMAAGMSALAAVQLSAGGGVSVPVVPAGGVTAATTAGAGLGAGSGANATQAALLAQMQQNAVMQQQLATQQQQIQQLLAAQQQAAGQPSKTATVAPSAPPQDGKGKPGASDGTEFIL